MLTNYQVDSREDKDFNQSYISGQGRGGHGKLDLFGLLGGKQSEIEKILTDPTTKYDPNTGGYNLNWHQRNVLNITDQDVYNARKSREVETMRRTDGDLAESFGINIDGTTSRVSLAKELKNAEITESLVNTLQTMPNSAEVLANLKTSGGIKDKDQVMGAIATLTQSNEDRNRDKANEVPLAQLKQQGDQFAATIGLKTKAQEDANKLTREQMALTQQNRWEDKRDARAENALEREDRAENRKMQVELEMAKIAQQDRASKEDLQFRREQFQARKSADLVAAITALGGLFMV